MDWWKTDNRNMPWREGNRRGGTKQVEQYKDDADGCRSRTRGSLPARYGKTESRNGGNRRNQTQQREKRKGSVDFPPSGEGMRQEQAGQGTQTIQTNENGWDELVRSLGLDGRAMSQVIWAVYWPCCPTSCWACLQVGHNRWA